MINNKKIELLAPAGGIEQFIAAVENGADAVYLGGRAFNARMKAGNFDDDTLIKAVDFAHKRGVDVHVTMNILLRDEELEEAINYASFLYETGVDALIVQDLGLASLIRKYMPDFPIHLSTQGTIHSLDGVKVATSMGFSRVVLSRELSYDDIKYICENTETEIETFVHGAICICYSGQCQLSRYFGGRSGNRGECAQPCRLKYDSFDESNKIIENGGHPLSPKDQSLIDHLGELIDAGVTSLKIEGRMKSPEYVGVVVNIYRKYIDEYYIKGYYNVSDDDRKALEQIFNRGGFTDEYFKGNSDDRLMSKVVPKHNGVLIGKVKKRVKGTDLVDVKLHEKLIIGDGIEIRPINPEKVSGKFVGNIITYYKETKNGIRIGDLKGEVIEGDLIYRISSKEQLETMRRSYKGVSLEGGTKEQRKTPIDIVAINKNGRLNVYADHPKGICCEIEKDVTNSNGSLNLEKFEVSMKKSGNTPFEINTVKYIGDTNIGLKVSEMNNIRRTLLEKLEEKLIIRRSKKSFRYIPSKYTGTQKRFERYFYDWESYESHHYEKVDTYLPVFDIIPITDFEEHYEEIQSKNVIPYISNVTKGREEVYIKENINKICVHCQTCGMYIGNIGMIETFKNSGVPLYGDYGLNAYNEETKSMLKGYGVELCADSLESMDPNNGRYPLMVMEHSMKEELLRGKDKPPLKKIQRGNSNQSMVVSNERKPLDTEKIKFHGEIVRYYF